MVYVYKHIHTLPNNVCTDVIHPLHKVIDIMRNDVRVRARIYTYKHVRTGIRLDLADLPHEHLNDDIALGLQHRHKLLHGGNARLQSRRYVSV